VSKVCQDRAKIMVADQQKCVMHLMYTWCQEHGGSGAVDSSGSTKVKQAQAEELPGIDLFSYQNIE
jgi:hypothetical protein